MRPPTVDPKHAREQTGGQALREKLDRPEPKPTQTMPGYGSAAQGQMQTPKPPRYGDPNYGDQAVGKARQEREQRQAQQQQQKQER